MSDLFRNVMQAFGHEADRAYQLIEDGMGLAMPKFLDENLEVPLRPNETHVVEATNLITDPIGAGRLTIWGQDNAPLVTTVEDLPPRVSSAVRGTAAAAGPAAADVYATFTPEETGLYYWYLLGETDSESTTVDALRARVKLNSGGFGVQGTDVQVAPASVGGWVLFHGQATLTAGQQYRLELALTNAVAGQHISMTGATMSFDTDPGEPFWGDLADDQHLYAWRAGGHGSPSLRYGPEVDMLALFEAEAEFSVQPIGMTQEQRQAYLKARWAARNKSWASIFRMLVADVIRAHDPTFADSGVRVVQNFPNRSFRVEIAYAEDGVMAARVKQLILDIKPAGLKIDPDDPINGIVWGTFLATPGPVAQTLLSGAHNPVATTTVDSTSGFVAAGRFIVVPPKAIAVLASTHNPVGTTTVATTTGWPSAGSFRIGDSVWAYTGKTGTTFTGVTLTSGPGGAMNASSPIEQYLPGSVFSYTAKTGTTFTGVALVSGPGGSQPDDSIVQQVIEAYGQAGEPV